MKKADGFLSFVKGVITGIGSLIPGLSSGSLIVSLNSYEEFIAGIKDLFKKNNRKLFLIVIPLLLGIVAGLVGGSHLVNYFFDNFKMQTILLFVGLIAGGFSLIIKKQKIKLAKGSIGLFILVFILAVLFNILVLNKVINISASNIIVSIVLGLLTGVSVVVPGFAASNFYILIGKYEYIIDTLRDYSNLTNIITGVIFVLCVLVSILLAARIIYHLLKKYRKQTYVIISGLMTASVVIALLQIGKIEITFVNIFTSILTFLWGFILAKNVEKE